MREIILDTETTGLDPRSNRIVEVGCVEVINALPTGKHFHAYINPEMPVPVEASAVHGLTDVFLADKPVFATIVDPLLEFLADDPLVIHNAAFDMGFLNAEFTRHGYAALPATRAIDTVLIARKKFPNQKNSLDALCERFKIDLSGRTLHGALLDAQLLAEVYLELRGGRQQGLVIEEQITTTITTTTTPTTRAFRAPRVHAPRAEEIAAHAEFLQQIKNPLWMKNK